MQIVSTSDESLETRNQDNAKIIVTFSVLLLLLNFIVSLATLSRYLISIITNHDCVN